MTKFNLKMGNTVLVKVGTHRGHIGLIKKIDRKKNILYIEQLSHKRFVMNRKEKRRIEKEFFLPIHISNVTLHEENNK